jgi:DNA end-binding protein Ku
MAPRSLRNLTLTLEVMAVPVKLYTAARSEGISLHLFHAAHPPEAGARIQNRLACPEHGPVPREEVVKGYQLDTDEYVRVAPDELAGLEAEASAEMAVLEFVPAAAVDPVYYEHSYYVGVGKGGAKGYRVLVEALEKRERVAVVRFVWRGKETLGLLRPSRGGLVLQTLYYADEVIGFGEVDLGPPAKIRPGERDLAVQLISALAQEQFHPESYRDEYRERFLAAVEAKREGRPLDLAQPEAPAPTTDLTAALRASLGRKPLARAPRPAREPRPTREPEPARPRRPRAEAGRRPRRRAS